MKIWTPFIVATLLLILVHSTTAQDKRIDIEGIGLQLISLHSTNNNDSGIELLRGSEASGTDWKLINDGGTLRILDGLDNFSTTGDENLRFLNGGTLVLPAGTDVADNINSGILILGNATGTNLGLDGNEILARNGTGSADLFLQHGSTSGFVSIGASASETTRKLTVQHDSWQMKLVNTDDLTNDWLIGASAPDWTAGANKLVLDNDSGSGNPILMLDGNTDAVAIGTHTIPGGFTLAVDGKSIAEEVFVELSDSWPDYVFDDSYQLTPIRELENQILRLGHLPNMPNADDIEENGHALGDIQKRLLEKIEELTLYIIELKKENEVIKERLSIVENNK